MPMQKVNDISMWYQVSGQGEPMFNVHGSVIGHTNFALITPHLTKHFRVIDYDLRGIGETDKPIQDYSMDAWADDLAALMDHLKIGRAHLHGTSMGGLIVMRFAAKYPERVMSLIINCTIARYDKAARMNKRVWRALIDAYGWTEPFWTYLALQCFSRDYIESDRFSQGMAILKASMIAGSPPEVFAAISRAVEEADVEPDLPKIRAPALVTYGEIDQLTPLVMGASGAGGAVIAEKIPDAELEVIPGCGHITHFEKPEETARLIVGFIDQARKVGKF